MNVLFGLCMVAGCAALRLTPVEYFHDVALNEVVITTVWTGASADEVERLVTAELEEELKTIAAIDEIRSSSQANLSDISIDFDETLDEVEYESAVNDVRAAIERATDLPADAERPVLREIITSEISTAVSLAVVDVGGVGPLALREVAQEAATRLRDLPGVNRVNLRGLQDREVHVLVDRDRAARYGLTVLEIADRIRRQNLNLPAGSLEDAEGEARLRATGDYSTLSDLLATVVRDNPDGTQVRVRDVARVDPRLEKERYITRYDGRPAAILGVSKKDDADVGELVRALDRWMGDFSLLVPPGIELHKTLDTSAFVEPRIRVLLDNLWAGALLVLLLLWASLGFRNALLTVIAIPFSFLTAIIFFPLLDISINSTTLMGMLLVSGMLVDDAIIVLDNVYRRVEEGWPLRRAVVEGTEEVLWPVTAAIATTVAAFAPLLLVGGTAGKFVSVLPKVVIVCLLASLFECLLILPVHYLDFGSRKTRGEGRLRFELADRLRRVIDEGFERLRAAYVRALGVVLAHSGPFGSVVLAVLLAAYAGALWLPIELFGSEFSSFLVNVETPTHYSLAETDRVVHDLEGEIAKLPDTVLDDWNTVVGQSVDLNFDQLSAPNLSITFVAIPQTEENQLRPERALQAVREALEGYRGAHPAYFRELRIEPQRNGPPVGRPVELRVQGEDYALAKSLAEEIKAHLRTIPGVSGVDDSLREGPREVRLRIDAARASQSGLTFEEIARAIRGANDGLVASSYRDPTAVEDQDIRVLLEPRYRDDIRDLLDVELRNPRGDLIRLGDVTELEVTRGYLAYTRFDARRAVTVFADVDDELATSVSVNQDLQARFADLEARYPEIELVYGGEYQATNEALASTFAAFPVGFLAIYMILAALFGSYLQPLIVVSSIPLGFAGLVFGVGVMGYNVSFLLFYSAIGLMGVVVNDAIVMVDFINRTRRDGLDLLEAVRHAGAQRLRPVLLTTLTTVFALLPMALGLQGASKSYGPFAASIAFGLMFAMLGTLFVVPLSYSSLIRTQARVGALLARPRGIERQRAW
jgi:HAE1 family hydrophobic/amphiphilic exporter-1